MNIFKKTILLLSIAVLTNVQLAYVTHAMGNNPEASGTEVLPGNELVRVEARAQLFSSIRQQFVRCIKANPVQTALVLSLLTGSLLGNLPQSDDAILIGLYKLLAIPASLTYLTSLVIVSIWILFIKPAQDAGEVASERFLRTFREEQAREREEYQQRLLGWQREAALQRQQEEEQERQREQDRQREQERQRERQREERRRREERYAQEAREDLGEFIVWKRKHGGYRAEGA